MIRDHYKNMKTRSPFPFSRCSCRLVSVLVLGPLVQLADGRLIAMGRLDDVADQERFGFKMPVSDSNDLGETWHYEASEFPVVSNTHALFCYVSARARIQLFTSSRHYTFNLAWLKQLPPEPKKIYP